MPRHDSAYVAAPKTQIVACLRCGVGIEVGYKHKRPKLCLGCAEKACIDNATQIHERTGPYYERWRQGIIDYGRFLEQGYEVCDEILPS